MQNTNSKKRSKLNVFFTIVLVVLILYTVLMFGLFLLGLNISLKHYQDIERDNNILIMDTFLAKLGFVRQQTGETERRKKILGLF